MPTLEGARTAGLPCWIDLSAPDAAKAAEFYARIFGWTYDVSGPEFGHYHNARLRGRLVAGIGTPQEEGTPPAWTVYFAADDIQAMTERARELGGTVLTEPMELPELGWMAIIQDPTGAVFGLWQALAHTGFGLTESSGAMTWCEVNTPDAAAAESFYTRLLDLKSQPVEGAGTTYYSLGRGDTNVAGILQMNEQWAGIAPHWMVYLQVDDADAAVEAVRRGGGKVSHGPFDSPYGRLAVANDPFGAAFTLLQRPAEG